MHTLNFLAKTADALVVPFISIGLYIVVTSFQGGFTFFFLSMFVSVISLPFLLLYFYRNSLNIIFCLVTSLIIFIILMIYEMNILSSKADNSFLLITLNTIPLIITGYFAKQVFLPTSSGRNNSRTKA
jgi:hypothetical protein